MRVLKLAPVVAVIVVVVLVTVAAGAWTFLREGETQTRGSCESAFYQVEVEPEDGGLEVTFELTSAAPGESWGVVIEHNGEALFEGQRTTDGDGEIDVDLPVATNANGRACTARVRHG